MWILTAMAVVAMQLLQLPGSKPSRAVFSPSAPLMYCHSATGQPADLVWDFFLFFTEPFLLLYRTKKIFWYKEMLLLRNMLHLYIVTKCCRLCKHEDDLCFQCNASLPRPPHTCTESKHSSRSKNTQSPNVQPSPFTSSPNLVEKWFRCHQRGCNGDKNRLNCTSVHRSQPSCTQDWILVDDAWEKLLTLVSPRVQTKRQM